jgi:hypothetical protein
MLLLPSSVSQLVASARPPLFALSHALLFVVDSRFLPCRCNSLHYNIPSATNRMFSAVKFSLLNRSLVHLDEDVHIIGDVMGRVCVHKQLGIGHC